jgi:hypothetical protein
MGAFFSPAVYDLLTKFRRVQQVLYSSALLSGEFGSERSWRTTRLQLR